jgi:flagellar basal-body rod protein FlgB
MQFYMSAAPARGTWTRGVMDLYAIPFFNFVRTRMTWLEQRQDVLAENIANAATPGYDAKDLKADANEGEFSGVLAATMSDASTMRTTSPMHMEGTLAHGGQFKAIRTPDREASPDGNSVVLEDQMMKLSDTQMQHEAATSLYKKAIEMLHIAIRGA